MQARRDIDDTANRADYVDETVDLLAQWDQVYDRYLDGIDDPDIPMKRKNKRGKCK